MWMAVGQILITLSICTVFFMLNVRIWHSHKRGVDPINAFKKEDLSVAKAIELEKKRQKIMDLG